LSSPDLQLGVSLICISRTLTEEVIGALDGSRVAALELSPRVLDADALGALRASLKEMMCRNRIRMRTIHGVSSDISALDESARTSAVTQWASSIDLATEFGAQSIICHASSDSVPPEQRPDRRRQSVRSLSELGERCAEVGVRIAVEFLPRTCLGNTVEELYELLGALDERTFGVCFDVNHLMDRHRDLAEDMRRLGPRLIALHLSDYDGVDEKHEMPGTGVIDWPSVMQVLRQLAYQGPFTYECHPEGSTPAVKIASIEKNYEWLTSL
jgi:sugar phosphate isomerase/epimerase